MATVNEDTGEAVVAFVSGIVVGFAATLLFVRMQKNRASSANRENDDYHYEGGDLFI